MRQWWSQSPQANIGLLLEPSGLLVVDLDSPQAQQEAQHLGLPPGPVVTTGNGQHRYYLANGHAGRTCKRGDSRSFDILASGYVVAPPSVHSNGKEYTWWLHPDDAPPQEPPQWVTDMLV